MRCITTFSFSFLINGSVKGHVIATRGLHQGHLLSPYVFLLCAKGLFAVINRRERRRVIHGLSVAQGALKYPTFFFSFADNSLIFGRATVGECDQLKKMFSAYEKALGQLINYDKSAISFSPNTKQLGIRDTIKLIINIEEVT